ncbi:MAG TPA: thiolase family protein [Candidatus Deferrimicrobiaceae bacterium]
MEYVILDAVRTAFGGFGGSLRDRTAADLGVAVSTAVLERTGLAPGDVDHVVFGNVNQTDAGSVYMARNVGLRAGIPKEVPAYQVARGCGTGVQALVSSCHMIGMGEGEVILAGGAENMSLFPHVLRNARWSGFKLAQSPVLEDLLWAAMVDPVPNMIMGLTAENVAEKFGIGKAEQDEFAVRSNQRAKRAADGKLFAGEIVPVKVKAKGGEKVFDQDEQIRPDTTMETLGKLPTVFKKGGTVTAGNSCGINDGAFAAVVTTMAKAKSLGKRPLGRIVAWGYGGVAPEIMGIGPVEAIKDVLRKAKKKLEDIALIEINEAFSAQCLAVVKELGADIEKVNVNGGAIAIGHPVGASGARVLVTLLHEMQKRDAKKGLATLCIGGGMGIAMCIARD